MKFGVVEGKVQLELTETEKRVLKDAAQLSELLPPTLAADPVQGMAWIVSQAGHNLSQDTTAQV